MSDLKNIVLNKMPTVQYPVGENLVQANDCTKMLAKALEDYLAVNELSTENVVLVGTGSSGLILSTFLSSHLPVKKIWHIKKENEVSHSHDDTIDIDTTDILVFVDDFTASGATYRRVAARVIDLVKRPIDIAAFAGYGYRYAMRDFAPKVVISNNNE